MIQLLIGLRVRASIATLCVAEVVCGAPPPNVIVILADDLGYGDVACFQALHDGLHDAKTPNIDRLARHSVLLTDFYAQPVCTPARYCLLTGLYLARSSDLRDLVVLDYEHTDRGLRGEETLAASFKKAGYKTAIVGKWHLGTSHMHNAEIIPGNIDERDIFHPCSHGFDFFYGFLGGSIDYCTHRKRGVVFDWYKNRDLLYQANNEGKNAHLDEGKYATHLVTECAVARIRQYAEQLQPFFLYVSYPAPHWAQTPQQDSLHVHQLPSEEDDRSSVHYRRYLKQFDDVYPGGDQTNWRKRLLAMVKAMDDGVGAITDCVHQLGLDENTIIVFASDNGGEIGYQAPHEVPYGSSNGPFTQGDKGTLYEGGIRVPALVRYIGTLPEGVVSDQISSIVDIKPTLLRLVGAKNSAGITDGIDLTPALTTPGHRIDREFFYYSGHFGKVLRRGDFKYIERRINGKTQREELYNVVIDPGEAVDLATTNPELLNDLRGRHADTLLPLLKE